MKENEQSTYHLILLVRPQPYWALVSCELKRVSALGRYMDVKGTLQDASTEALQQLAKLCAEMQPDAIYVRYANKKVFRHQKDFWESDDATLQKHVKRMTDQRLLQALRKASSLDIPILYAANEGAPLHIADRLTLDETTTVKPLMHFTRHEQGTTYRLQLRLENEMVTGEEAAVVTPADHRMAVLSHEPGLFILDHRLLRFGEGFSGKLLLPFVKKKEVEIPRRIENDYFRRFILRNVSKAEVMATGFDIEDTDVEASAKLVVEKSFLGDHLLTLRFQYGNIEYAFESTSGGQVQLQETADGFRFIRSRRNRQVEQQAVEAVLQTGAALSAHGNLSFSSTAAMIDWLREHGPLLRQQGIEVVQPSEQVYYIGPLSVEQCETWNGDWLQTDVTVVLDEGRLRLPFRELRSAILHGEQDYLLPTGERLLIPQEWLERYGELLLAGQPSGKGFRRHRSQIREQESVGTGTVPARSSEPSVAVSPPAALRAHLRPYQQTGYEWLWQNFVDGTGCCLSDEMGLGKTLQTIALLLKYKETSKRTESAQPSSGMLFTDEEMRGESQSSMDCHRPSVPFHTSLVVAPASVVHNWINELKRFAPSLLACDYTGDVNARRDKRKALLRWDVVVTTYHTLRSDIERLAPLQFGIVVFDESQAFKTSSSQVHQAVSQLTALHRLALSGTPVENNLHELWSLMNVLNPNLLGSHNSFRQSFVAPIVKQMEQQRTQLLQRLIAPYFLKRTKEQVLSDLPERQDEVVVCPMTDQQVSHYAVELSKARNAYMEAQLTGNSMSASADAPGKGHVTALNVIAAIQRLRQIANGEGKMQVVFERLESLRGTGHKVLLFSEYVTMLNRVGEEMKRRGWSFAMLTGETQHREQVIDRFQGDADCQFFLISLKAGGVGLNLTAADYVFVLDPWWNVAAEEQAIARSHRIGQHRPVFVYRFVSENTLEQQILTIQERKQTLIDSVMPFISAPVPPKGHFYF